MKIGIILIDGEDVKEFLVGFDRARTGGIPIIIPKGKVRLVNFENGEFIEIGFDHREEIAPIDTEKGIRQRDQAREEMLKKAEVEKKPKRSYKKRVQKVPKKKVTESHSKLPGKRRSRAKKYPDEMEAFVRENAETHSNVELVDLINKKFKVDITKIKIGGYMQRFGIKRTGAVYSKGKKEAVSGDEPEEKLKDFDKDVDGLDLD